MAKTIEDLIVRLKAEGFENIDKLRGSFRELNKVTGFTEKDIDKIRGRLNAFAKEAGNTEAVNKGLIEAFKGLKSQVDVNGKAYGELAAEITRMESVLRGSTAAIDKQRAVLLEHARTGTQNAKSLQQQIDGLERLQRQTRPGSAAFLQLGKDIDQATKNLGRFKSEASAAAATLTQIPAASLEKITAQIGRLQGQMQKLNISSDEFLRYQQRIALIGTVRSITESRQQVRARNAMYESPQYAQYAEGRAANLELPNTTAALSLELSQLGDRLANTTRGTVEYLTVATQMAGVQRELTSVTQGYAQALVMGLRTNTVPSSAKNIKEVIAALRAEMEQLDTTTAEGSRHYAENANAANRLEKQLNDLAGAYRNVGDMATQAATAEQNAANKRIRDNYLNRGMVRQQEAAFAELGQRVRQGVATTPLLLPAAGQTSAPGTGLQISAGQGVRVRQGRASGAVQQIFAPGSGVGGVRFPGERERLQPTATAEEADRARRSYIAETDARRANTAAVEQQRARMETLRAAVDKATTANTGSINSLTNLREALANLRNELPSTDKEFKQLTNRLQAVDERANKLSTNVGRKLTGMQLAQGVGAALSGGIFGGPEGLIGGLGGLAIGGVGGSFAGAAFGAQVGMFRQQLGAVTEYSARIDKLQIALRGIVGSQDAYKQALAAAASVTRDLNIPQEVAIQGMTRLSAAVKGAGGNVSDSAFAFRAINEAVKATGGNAEQVDGALLALTQVFSKGKVSAEELNQIAERLPGTFTLFAKAAGMTGPQLQKALQEGQVGLNDLLKFLQLISSQYGQTALKIAASSQDAGARLSVAMKQMQLDVGRALQPIGASLQSAFADFITKITPAFIAAAQGLAAAFEFLIENKTASGLATFALQLGAVTAGLVALRSAMTAISALNIATTFTSAAASAKITGDVLASTATSAGSLSAKLVGLRGLIGNLALSFAKPLILTVAVVGAAVVIDYLNKINAAKDRLKRAGTASRGDTWLQEIGGSALDVAALRRQVQAAGDTYQYLADKIKQAREEQATTPFKPRKEYLQTQINADLADLAIAQSRYRAGIDALAQRTPAKPSLPRFPGLSVEDEKKKNLAEEKQARDAQTAAAEQQRLNNEIFDQQIKAQDRLFEHGIALDRQRYEMQKRLDDLQSQNRVMRETGVSREIVSNFEDLQRGLRDIEERRMETTAAIVRAKQAQQSAEARSSFAAAGAAALSGTAGIIARTGSTGQSTGPHLDARWADGRRISVADVDRYISVNGRTPSSYGITSPYGPRSMFGRSFHAGIDFGTPSGSGITLKDGATLLRDLGFTGAGGYAVEINTKQGPMRLLHLQRGSTKLPTGALAQQGRAIKTAGGAAIEALDVTQAERQQQLLESKVAEERAALFEQFILKASASLRDQNAALRDNAELQKLRNRLTLEGVSSSQIDLEEALLKVRQDQNKQEQTYKDLTATTRNPKVQATLNTALAEQNAGFAEQVRLLREAAAAKREFDDAMQFRQDSDIGKGLRDGAKSYVESIGTMREATSQLAQTGIKGVEDAIFSLVTTGTANFRDFAKQILENTARMIIQQLILRTVMQAIGAIGGGGGSALAKTFEMPGAGFPTSGFKFANGGAFASNGIVPFAMGGVVNRPTMFAFANGGVGRLGLMGEAGPEAIMPLRRLPSGRLGIESAGGGAPVTVNVSVDATGSQVQGDAGQASQLARVVAGAVQAELIKQKRPGGILSS